MVIGFIEVIEPTTPQVVVFYIQTYEVKKKKNSKIF